MFCSVERIFHLKTELVVCIIKYAYVFCEFDSILNIFGLETEVGFTKLLAIFNTKGIGSNQYL